MDHNVSMLIFTVFGEKDRTKTLLLMMFLPTILYYLKYFKEKFFNYFNNKSTIKLVIKHDKGKPVTNNPSYHSVCWYLESFTFDSKVKKLICEEHGYKGKQKTDFVVPLFIPYSSSNIVYEKCKINIQFTYTEQKKQLLYPPILYIY